MALLKALLGKHFSPPSPFKSRPVHPPSAKLFDLAEEYDEMLNCGIRLSGEDKFFFIAGRVRDLKRQLPSDFDPRRILDFGCGGGDTSCFLAKIFPNAHVVGVDVAEQVLAYASNANGSARVTFRLTRDYNELEKFDLCYANGVFHHLKPAERPSALREIHKALAPGGYLALFENNPWNIGARMVMSRIPFDRDAQMLPPIETRKLVQENGFLPVATRFLFYLPRSLSRLRPLEAHLVALPLGAQYYVLARKE
jgi:SAM-dependent methyltransferase